MAAKNAVMILYYHSSKQERVVNNIGETEDPCNPESQGFVKTLPAFGDEGEGGGGKDVGEGGGGENVSPISGRLILVAGADGSKGTAGPGKRCWTVSPPKYLSNHVRSLVVDTVPFTFIRFEIVQLFQMHVSLPLTVPHNFLRIIVQWTKVREGSGAIASLRAKTLEMSSPSSRAGS